jgi:hypothetical protein
MLDAAQKSGKVTKNYGTGREKKEIPNKFLSKIQDRLIGSALFLQKNGL